MIKDFIWLEAGFSEYEFLIHHRRRKSYLGGFEFFTWVLSNLTLTWAGLLCRFWFFKQQNPIFTLMWDFRVFQTTRPSDFWRQQLCPSLRWRKVVSTLGSEAGASDSDFFHLINWSPSELISELRVWADFSDQNSYLLQFSSENAFVARSLIWYL